MPPSVYDSEDGSGDELVLDACHSGARLNIDTNHELHLPELEGRTASHSNEHMYGPARVDPTSMPRIMTEADMFDIESTFNLDGAADKGKSKKRRQTVGEIAESPRKRVKESARSHTATHNGITAARMQVSEAALPRESETMPNEDAVESMQGAKSFGTQVARENVLMLPSSGDMAESVVETGDVPDVTIRFATGEQQMMVEQALRNAEPGIYSHDPDTVHVNQDGTGEHNKQNGDHGSNSSGSIPWSAEPIGNTQTPSTGSKKRTQSSQSAKSNKSAKSARRIALTQVTPSHGLDMSSSQVSQDELSMPAPDYIPHHASRTRGASTETGSQDRISDHVATGNAEIDDYEKPSSLDPPQEHYKAKPSRSRSAAVEYTPIDWSVPPEKFGKKKANNRRTRTASAIGDSDVQLNNDADEQLQIEAEIARRAKEARDEDSSGARISTAIDKEAGAGIDTPTAAKTPKTTSMKKGRKNSARKEAQSQLGESQADHAVDQTVTPIHPGHEDMAPEEVPTHAVSKELSIPVIERPFATAGTPASANPSPLPSIMSPGPDAAAPASTPTPSSMAPPSSTASSKKKKSKRSHTTIFEDHVGLRRPGMEEEPDVEVVSLKQQQATRKKRGRPKKQPLPEEKLEVEKDEAQDDQDVVMHDAGITEQAEPQAQMEKEKQKPQPTKRGRGRPRKSQVQEVQETQEEVQVEDEAQEQAAVVVAEEEEDLFAAVDAVRDDAAVSQRDTFTTDVGEEAQGVIDVGTGKENGAVRPATEKVAAVVKEKQAPHSPIKKALTVYRVGLSRKQRIQPLLRIMKK
ncbi:Hypothetical protein D9617_1g083140 [Elsinoe fawcettii]|nr:Hypothetical protein D9617_1g083140 [Elsinoe fawcettii]